MTPAHSSSPRLSQICIPKGSAYSPICLKLWPPLLSSSNLSSVPSETQGLSLVNPPVSSLSICFSFLPWWKSGWFLGDCFSCRFLKFFLLPLGTTELAGWTGCPSCSSVLLPDHCPFYSLTPAQSLWHACHQTMILTIPHVIYSPPGHAHNLLKIFLLFFSLPSFCYYSQ